jgi:hypothetical protein
MTAIGVGPKLGHWPFLGRINRVHGGGAVKDRVAQREPPPTIELRAAFSTQLVAYVAGSNSKTNPQMK